MSLRKWGILNFVILKLKRSGANPLIWISHQHGLKNVLKEVGLWTTDNASMLPLEWCGRKNITRDSLKSNFSSIILHLFLVDISFSLFKMCILTYELWILCKIMNVKWVSFHIIKLLVSSFSCSFPFYLFNISISLAKKWTLSCNRNFK